MLILCFCEGYARAANVYERCGSVSCKLPALLGKQPTRPKGCSGLENFGGLFEISGLRSNRRDSQSLLQVLEHIRPFKIQRVIVSATKGGKRFRFRSSTELPVSQRAVALFGDRKRIHCRHMSIDLKEAGHYFKLASGQGYAEDQYRDGIYTALLIGCDFWSSSENFVNGRSEGGTFSSESLKNVLLSMRISKYLET
jgi:hypothetical protein